MKLVEVARKYLTQQVHLAWYLRRVEMLEPEEVARRLEVSVASVHQYVWRAEDELVNHLDEIEDPDDYLAFKISILRGHRVENAEDSTPKAVFYRQQKGFFARKD